MFKIFYPLFQKIKPSKTLFYLLIKTRLIEYGKKKKIVFCEHFILFVILNIKSITSWVIYKNLYKF